MRAAHRKYGVSVPSRPASFARFGHRAGWPSYSHRPASVDMLETPSPAGSTLSRESRDPLQSLPGAAPHGASSDGPPAPHRLEQPSPRTSLPLTSLVVLAGTAQRSPWTARKLARSTPCDAHLVRWPAQPRPPLCRAFRQRQSCNRNAFRRVAMSRVTPGLWPRKLDLFEELAQPSHRSHLGAAAACASTSCGVLLGQRRFTWVALRLPTWSGRAMLRTDFCHLTSSYQYPRLAGSRCVAPLLEARAYRGDYLMHVSAISLWRVARALPGRGSSSRWALSSRRDACIPSLWHPCRLSRGAAIVRTFTETSREQPRSPLCLLAWTSRPRKRSGAPSIERKPLPRDVLSNARLGSLPAPRLGHRDAGRRRFWIHRTRTTFRRFLGSSSDSRPHVRLPAGRASLNLGAVRRLLQPIVDARAHPFELLCLRTRVRLPPHYSLAPTDASCVGRTAALPQRWPANRALHAPAFARSVPLAWTKQHTGRSAREKAETRALDDVARALLVTPRASGSPA